MLVYAKLFAWSTKTNDLLKIYKLFSVMLIGRKTDLICYTAVSALFLKVPIQQQDPGSAVIILLH